MSIHFFLVFIINNPSFLFKILEMIYCNQE